MLHWLLAIIPPALNTPLAAQPLPYVAPVSLLIEIVPFGETKT
jgi:hypothetical protein